MVLVQTLKWPIRCAVKHLTNNKNSPLGLFIVLSFLIVAACSYFVSCIITVSFCLRLVHSYGLGTDLKKASHFGPGQDNKRNPISVVLVQTFIKWPIRCAVKHMVLVQTCKMANPYTRCAVKHLSNNQNSVLAQTLKRPLWSWSRH